MSKIKRFEICNKRGDPIVVIEGRSFKEALQEFIDQNPPLSLIGMNLSRRNMSGMILKGVIFFSADLSNTNLRDTDQTDADFTNAISTNADFTGAFCRWPREEKEKKY